MPRLNNCVVRANKRAACSAARTLRWTAGPHIALQSPCRRLQPRGRSLGLTTVAGVYGIDLGTTNSVLAEVVDGALSHVERAYSRPTGLSSPPPALCTLS